MSASDSEKISYKLLPNFDDCIEDTSFLFFKVRVGVDAQLVLMQNDTDFENHLYEINIGKAYNKTEPPRDKTNKVNVGPAKTQISLGIRPVWSEFHCVLNG